MSTKISGLRRVGIVGLSTLVVTSMMTLSAAPSFAAANQYKVVAPVLDVAEGAAAAPAANLTLEAINSWVAGTSQTFTIAGNDCSSASGISAAIGFSALPTVTVTDPSGTNNVADTVPAFTKATSSSTPACHTAGISDVVTLTLTNHSTGTGTDTYLFTLSGITYKVGATAATGDVNVDTAGTFVGLPVPTTVVNANVVDSTFTNTPVRVAALPSATGVSLGTQTITELQPGTVFPATTTNYTVVLTPSAGSLTLGVTPTITASGLTVVSPPATTNTGSYTFHVITPGTLAKATLAVSGLTMTAPAATEVVSLGATVTSGYSASVKVVNVLDYSLRTGGATRYETAAALFDSQLGGGPTHPFTNATSVVLSGGELYPDALSANYLTNRLGNGQDFKTGTLLTTPGGLSTAARVALLTPTGTYFDGFYGDRSVCIGKVYITGQTVAISQAVQDQVEAMHQCNDTSRPFILTVRLGGPTRYETNQIVNEHFFVHAPTVLLASGAGYADALALGPVAANKGFPLILTQGGATLGATAAAQLSDFSPTNIVIAGGIAVVSQSVQDSLTAEGYNVVRLGGDDRTLTAALIATWATRGVGTTGFLSNSLMFDSTNTYITTGSNFADAVAAGPVAAVQGAHGEGQVILTSNSPTDLGLGIPSYLGGNTVEGEPATTLHALGLTLATSNGLMKAAAATIEVP